MISQRFFVIHLGNKKSRKRRLANDIPQGSVLRLILFNIYMADIPSTNCKKYTYVYADDIVIITSGRNFKTCNTLSTDLTKLANYFYNWRLKLNPFKTVSSCFHMANRLTKVSTECLPPRSGNIFHYFTQIPWSNFGLFTYFWKRHHRENITAKTNARCNMLKILAGNSWGSEFHVLRAFAGPLLFCSEILCTSLVTQ